MDQIELIPYLFFERNCKAAFEFYKSVFGGELQTQTRGEVDKAAPDDMKDLLIHANLNGGMIHLMGSDRTDAGGPQKRVGLSLSGQDDATMQKLYDQLAEGGSADHPLKKEFWGDTFGDLTDKFGTHWLININAKKD